MELGCNFASFLFGFFFKFFIARVPLVLDRSQMPSYCSLILKVIDWKERELKKNRSVFFLSSLHKVDELNACFVLETTQPILII